MSETLFEICSILTVLFETDVFFLDGRNEYSQKDSQRSTDEPGQKAIFVLGYRDDALLAVRTCHTSRNVGELWHHGDDHWN